MTQVDAGEFRQNAGELLIQVKEHHDSILIQDGGKAVAALVDAGVFARLREMDVRFDQARRQVAAAWADITEEVGLAEIDRICSEERHR